MPMLANDIETTLRRRGNATFRPLPKNPQQSPQSPHVKGTWLPISRTGKAASRSRRSLVIWRTLRVRFKFQFMFLGSTSDPLRGMGFASGSVVKDPYTGKLFLVP